MRHGFGAVQGGCGLKNGGVIVRPSPFSHGAAVFGRGGALLSASARHVWPGGCAWRFRYTRGVNDTDRPIDSGHATPGKASLWSTLGWAAYLACSWTWCIGMFLPVLLVRDYGIWGFVVFAVPNVIGAGAMGWVLKNGAAERIVARHGLALRTFSMVTFAFQLYFCLMLSDALPYAAFAFPIILLLFTLIRIMPRIGAAVLWVASVGLLATVWQKEGLSWTVPAPAPRSGGLVFLMPVCVFGFALCPYMDLTFLRARESVDARGSKPAFTLGFGVFFLAMIVGTLGYSALALARMEKDNWSGVAIVERLVAIHIMLQLLYTMSVHGVEVRRRMTGTFLRELIVVALTLWAMIAIISFAYNEQRFGVLLRWEVIYRCFMSFYGLVFPAYVWLCMIPTPDGHSGIEGAQGRRKLLVLAVACAIAAPCYWMGFIERVEWWLAPGLGVVLLARLLVRGTGVPPVPPDVAALRDSR